MKVQDGVLPGIKLIQPQIFSDHRGYFMESYNSHKLAEAGIKTEFSQDNHSMSTEAGVIRGLHYQLQPEGQAKLVRVTAGAIYDVVVDIRKGSPFYGKWEGFELSAENKHQLFVPAGFAHGFCTLAPVTEVQYKVDRLYSPEHDRGIAWNDESLGIQWPVQNPILSAKDERHPTLADAEINFIYSETTGGRSS